MFWYSNLSQFLVTNPNAKLYKILIIEKIILWMKYKRSSLTILVQIFDWFICFKMASVRLQMRMNGCCVTFLFEKILNWHQVNCSCGYTRVGFENKIWQFPHMKKICLKRKLNTKLWNGTEALYSNTDYPRLMIVITSMLRFPLFRNP